MFIEKKRKSVSPRLFTANGTADGLVTVADARDFFVKQKVHIKSNTLPNPKQLEIKRFVTNNSFKVGPIGDNIRAITDISAYLVADSATISADEQDRPGIKPDEIQRATYAEEPIVAKRVIMVDEFGNYYNSTNPLPINAAFSGSLSVNLDAFDNPNPDSVLGVGSEDGTQTGTRHVMRVDSDLDLRVGISNGSNKAGVNTLGELSVIDSVARNSLNSILNALTVGPVPVSLVDEPIKISGTENGQPNGTEFTFVNNRLQQILKAKDRVGTITYADFGTKNQRITQITYTAPSIGVGPGYTAVKTFTYTLVGNKYRRDTPGDWSLV
jgi:hypothetical protein